jgi:hypothetical protein
MTVDQFVEMIGGAETGGMPSLDDRERAIGDHGLAGGFFQQHWVWRRDYWEPWMWSALKNMDAQAVRNFAGRFPGETARELANRYNLGHEAPDPAYDKRCLDALAAMSIPDSEYDAPLTS